LRSARHGRGPLRRFRQLLQAGRALLVSGQKRLDGEVGGGDLERRSKLPDIKLMWQWGPPKVDWSARFSDGWPDASGASAKAPADAQLIVIENSFSLKAPRSSVTRTVKVNVPAEVGVPEMVFSRFGSSRPGGSAPATTDQVKG